MPETSDYKEYKSALRLALTDLYPEQALRQWFDPLRMACDVPQQRLVVTWPHRLFGDWVSRQDMDSLERAVCRIYGSDWKLDLQNPDHTPSSSAFRTSTTDQAQPDPPQAGQLRANGENAPERSPEDSPNDSSGDALGRFPFGPAYTLDNYLANAKNNFPLTVLREAAAAKLDCNPLVVYGGAGSGKTHLARALGNALSTGPGNGIVFCGSADDMAAIQNALGDRGAVQRFSTYAAVIVDDLQRLLLAPRLGDILPVIIDQCLERNKPFLCTTCLTPAEWRQFPERIGSRLEQGLVMVLHEADMDIRLRYVQQQNRALRLNLGRTQVLTLAQQCTGFRRLIGIIQRLSALKNVFGQDVSDQDMDRVLMHTADVGTISAPQIIRLVASRCAVRPEDIVSGKRHPRIARARQMAMFLCRTLLGASYPAIGRLFGGRDHSTVIHSIKKIQVLWDNDKDTHTMLTELSLACRQNAK